MEYSAYQLRYRPLYSCFLKDSFSVKVATKSINDRSLEKLPEELFKSPEDIYKLLCARTRRSLVDRTKFVVRHRIALFKNLMYSDKLDDLPLYINSYDISPLVKWRFSL
jgi:hypothetical protein